MAIKISKSGLIAAIVLEQKGLSQYGLKFFARLIPQTGVRRSINTSDAEHSIKVLRVAAATVREAVEAIPPESPVGDHQANGSIESAVGVSHDGGAREHVLPRWIGRRESLSAGRWVSMRGPER